MNADAESHHHHEGIGDIALCLSGGGVRAVGFHLGTLEMLDTLGLLKNVKILSTVSGGSLTGTGYALSQHLGKPFDLYFHQFCEFLPKLNTIEDLLDGLGSDQQPSPSGRRDMITVMANIYNEAYFKKYFSGHSGDTDQSPRFDILLKDGAEGSHLTEMCFNATEFQTGSAFRFQRSEFHCLIGNASIMLCRRHARQIRMADIMASSSCIPAGMEPLFFPHDFHWPDDTNQPGAERKTCDEIRQQLSKNLHKSFRLYPNREVDHFALMDGGVYDNQGIVSVLLAMNRRITRKKREEADPPICGKALNNSIELWQPDWWAKWFAGKLDDTGEEASQTARAQSDEAATLLIISDTPVRKDSQYPKIGQAVSGFDTDKNQTAELIKGRFSRLTIGGLDKIGWVISTLLLLSAGIIFYEQIWPNRDWHGTNWFTILDDLLQVTIPLILTVVLGGGLFFLRRKLRQSAEKIQAVLPPDRWRQSDPWQYVKRLRVKDLIDMARLRVGSVSALTASIFMGRIRSLTYTAAYLRENVENHIIANQIFALECHHGRDVDGNEKDMYLMAQSDGASSEALTDLKPLGWPADFPGDVALIAKDAVAICSMAAHLPTKLWINKIGHDQTDGTHQAGLSKPLDDATHTVCDLNERRRKEGKKPLDDLDVLVICGQMTICYKLMVHLWNEHTKDGNWQDNKSRAIFEKCRDRWNELVADPTCLLDARKASAEEAARKAAA